LSSDILELITKALITPNTLFYVRAYATTSAGTSYENPVSFTTLQVTSATLTTTAISLINQTSAASGGNITYILDSFTGKASTLDHTTP
jgi:hypothetical protein